MKLSEQAMLKMSGDYVVEIWQTLPDRVKQMGAFRLEHEVEVRQR